MASSLRWARLLALFAVSVGCDTADAPGVGGSAPGGKADTPQEGEEASEGVDVNDVSVLFALPEDRPLPSIALNDDALQITDVIFADVLSGLAADAEYPFDPVDTTLAVTRPDWFVVSARYDPCAVEGGTHDFDTGQVAPDVAEGCVQLLRLVAQPFPGNEFGIHPDAAFHLIYALGVGVPSADDPNLAVMRQLRGLAEARGASTRGRPLDVHPGLLDDLARGETTFADALDEGLHSILGRSRLISIAATSLMNANDIVNHDGGAVWAFVGGDIEEGRWRSKPQELEFRLGERTLTRTKDFVTCLRGGCNKGTCLTEEEGGDCGPLRPADESVATLHDIGITTPPEIKEQWAANAHRIDDPLAFDIPEIACADCHMTRGTYARFGVHSSLERRTPPAGITGYGSCDAMRGNTWNTRNFGYFDRRATVSTRTVLETAFVADFINDRVLDVDNPGRDCSAVDESVWECLVHPEDQPQETCAAEHTANCLAACE